MSIRAAFTYPWKPRTWYSGNRYTPWLGSPYTSADLDVIRSQISQLEYGKFQAAISSWWGQGDLTDANLKLQLAAAKGTSMMYCIYYEPTIDHAASDLDYLFNNYANDANYLKVNGKPVVFIYNTSVKNCTDVATWERYNNGRFYLNFQVFSGYTNCSVKGESYHQYGAFYSTQNPGQDHQKNYCFSVCPGFWKYNEGQPRLARDPVRFAANVAAMVASNEPWQVVISLDEQGEGTGVEPAMEWQSASGMGVYLDILAAH